MATTINQPETIQGKTTRLNVAAQDAKMAAVAAIVSADTDTLKVMRPLIKAFNDLAYATDELNDFQRVQIQYLETLCRNLQVKGEARK